MEVADGGAAFVRRFGEGSAAAEVGGLMTRKPVSITRSAGGEADASGRGDRGGGVASALVRADQPAVSQGSGASAAVEFRRCCCPPASRPMKVQSPRRRDRGSVALAAVALAGAAPAGDANHPRQR